MVVKLRSFNTRTAQMPELSQADMSTLPNTASAERLGMVYPFNPTWVQVPPEYFHRPAPAVPPYSVLPMAVRLMRGVLVSPFSGCISS